MVKLQWLLQHKHPSQNGLLWDLLHQRGQWQPCKPFVTHRSECLHIFVQHYPAACSAASCSFLHHSSYPLVRLFKQKLICNCRIWIPCTNTLWCWVLPWAMAHQRCCWPQYLCQRLQQSSHMGSVPALVPGLQRRGILSSPSAQPWRATALLFFYTPALLGSRTQHPLVSSC